MRGIYLANFAAFFASFAVKALTSLSRWRISNRQFSPRSAGR